MGPIFAIEFDGHCYAIDVTNPSSTAGDLGFLGSVPNIRICNAATRHGADILAIGSASVLGSVNTLYTIDPNDPTNAVGFGPAGTLPGTRTPSALASDDTALYLISDDSAGVELLRVDPTNPSNTASPFGRIGPLPSGFPTSAVGLTFYRGSLYALALTRAVPSGRATRGQVEIWVVNHANPADTSGIYGLAGRITVDDINSCRALLDHDGTLYMTHSGTELYQIVQASDANWSFIDRGDFATGGPDEQFRSIRGLALFPPRVAPDAPRTPTVARRTNSSLTLTTVQGTGGIPTGYRWRISTDATIADDDTTQATTGNSVTFTALTPGTSTQ